ncbi:MAG: hypothetical protein QW835_02690 [Candidatus Hadarchaeum sp.]
MISFDDEPFSKTSLRYAQFQRRGFEYFPNSNQLLLVTGDLVVFKDDGRAIVKYVPFNPHIFEDWVKQGYIDDELYTSTTLSRRSSKYLAMAEAVVPPQHRLTAQLLELISQFSYRKQCEILGNLKKVGLSLGMIEELQRCLRAKKKAKERQRNYYAVALELYHKGVCFNSQQLLLVIHVMGGKFLLVKFEEPTLDHYLNGSEQQGLKVFLVRLDRKARSDEIIGRLIRNGKLNRSRHVSVFELNRSEILQHIDVLKEAAEKVDEPYRTKINNFLVLAKLSGTDEKSAASP